MTTTYLLYLSRLSTWLCILFLTVGCQPEETFLTWPPSVYFEPYAVRHPLNLTRVLGEKVQLVSIQDTLAMHIVYEPTTGLNLLTNAANGDTLQRVWVTHYRRLYYFTWPINDTCYWVHAVRIRRGQVQGITDPYEQMKQLEHAIRTGRFPEILRHQDSIKGTMRLQFNRNVLRRFYAATLDSLPVYHIASYLPKPDSPPPPVAAQLPPTTTAPLLRNLYPNPATDVVHVTLASSSPCKLSVFDMAGRLMLATPAIPAVSILDVHQLPAGRYVVRICEPATGRAASHQLLVK